jgi:hypothetical protein
VRWEIHGKSGNNHWILNSGLVECLFLSRTHLTSEHVSKRWQELLIPFEDNPPLSQAFHICQEHPSSDSPWLGDIDKGYHKSRFNSHGSDFGRSPTYLSDGYWTVIEGISAAIYSISKSEQSGCWIVRLTTAFLIVGVGAQGGVKRWSNLIPAICASRTA